MKSRENSKTQIFNHNVYHVLEGGKMPPSILIGVWRSYYPHTDSFLFHTVKCTIAIKTALNRLV